MAIGTIQASQGIGPSFSFELESASLMGKAITWQQYLVRYWEYDAQDRPNGLTSAEITTLEGVISAHDPEQPRPPNEEDEARESVIAYAAYIDGLSDALRKQQTSTQEFQDFLDNIAMLGVEGI